MFLCSSVNPLFCWTWPWYKIRCLWTQPESGSLPAVGSVHPKPLRFLEYPLIIGFTLLGFCGPPTQNKHFAACHVTPQNLNELICSIDLEDTHSIGTIHVSRQMHTWIYGIYTNTHTLVLRQVCIRHGSHRTQVMLIIMAVLYTTFSVSTCTTRSNQCYHNK